MKNIIVVGGGAAGILAAIAASKSGNKVTILEKNEKLGKKIYITGKGRCNVTNASDIEDILKQIVSNEKFMYSAIYTFDNAAIMHLLEEEGCALKVERGNRVFPVSDHASDVTRALLNILKRERVTIEYFKEVNKIETQANEIKGVKTKDGKFYEADVVILATGGKSYPLTGSDGYGMELVKELGHTIKTCKPSLVPFELQENYGKQLQGMALKNVSLKLEYKNKIMYEDFGELLFTHFGISGPLVISASSYYAKKCFGEQIACFIDLKPALSFEQLDKRVLRDFEEYKNKQFKNAIEGLFPSKLIPIMIEISGISPEKKVHEITREERQHFVRKIKNWDMTITGTRGFSEAIITQGGINVKEVNPSTMESKVIKGLYLAGEILDIDALTGGYNLQLAWSTGYLAGSSC